MLALLLVCLGSVVGAPLRYVVDREVQGRHELVFPFGTLVVNLSGALALGLIVGGAARGGMSTLAVDALGTGLIGSYTTFSTFSWETLRMVGEGSLWHAGANVVVSVGGGVAAAALGVWATTLG
jgi:fluoride exporter